jgi:hypothetical protein
MSSTARHWFLSRATGIQSMPSFPISLRFVLILHFDLHLGLRGGLFSSVIPTKILYIFFISAWVLHATSHPSRFDRPNNSLYDGESVSCSFSFGNFFWLYVASILSGPCALRVLISEYSLCSSRVMRDQISHLSRLRHYATSRKVAGSSPVEMDFFNLPNPSSLITALGRLSL